ncbi:MAG: efflux RND transporter periplasmic adaptor subunit [Nitrospirales bacterium]|nr:HlyD family efflux transporter periplasmic adaptor subunit [Nitrospirales bacterium]
MRNAPSSQGFFRTRGTAAVADHQQSPPAPASSAGAGPNIPGGPSSDIDPKILVDLLHLESQIRSAQTVKELSFLLANETRRLVTFRQAFLISISPTNGQACRIESVSSVAVLDRQAPLIKWLEKVSGYLWNKHLLDVPCYIIGSQIPREWQSDWKRNGFSHVLWCPLKWANQRIVAGIWLARETIWKEGEDQLIRRVAETAAHAWQILQPNGTRAGRWKQLFQKKWVWTGVVGLMLAMCLPVRLATLAPVEVIARDPAVVTAPLEGVIAQVVVKPNTFVEEGDVLFRYDDKNFRNQFDVAEKNLAVALMEYRKTSQEAFLEDETGGNLPVQFTEVRLKEVERDYAWERLEQVDVTSPRAGVVIFGDPTDWVGRPIVVGERIMEVADPEQVELKIDLPVEDAIVLEKGAEVDIFLDANPLKTISARLVHASYHAEVLPTQVLAYRVKAALIEPGSHIRIGWQGTAKIYGEEVPLFLYLFRRPFSVARQTVGF